MLAGVMELILIKAKRNKWGRRGGGEKFSSGSVSLRNWTRKERALVCRKWQNKHQPTGNAGMQTLIIQS